VKQITIQNQGVNHFSRQAKQHPLMASTISAQGLNTHDTLDLDLSEHNSNLAKNVKTSVDKYCEQDDKRKEQAGAELCQAQVKLGIAKPAISS
jgi:hypothetical protein